MGGSTATPRFLFKCYTEHPDLVAVLVWQNLLSSIIISSRVSEGPVAVETRAVVFARADQ